MADRTFRAEDGTELHEADLQRFAKIVPSTWPQSAASAELGEAVKRLRAALAAGKTCGATRVIRAVADDHAEFVFEDVCILPRGHHPLARGCCAGAQDDRVGGYDDPIHSPGHMTDQSTWSEA
jgi:hypothetical protein